MGEESADIIFYAACRALLLEVDPSIMKDILVKGRAAICAAYKQGGDDATKQLKRRVMAVFGD